MADPLQHVRRFILSQVSGSVFSFCGCFFCIIHDGIIHNCIHDCIHDTFSR